MILGYPLLAILNILHSLITLYMFVMIATAVISWVNPDPLNPIVRFLRQITEPVLDRVRPYTPDLNGVDLSPLAVIILLIFTRDGILPIFFDFGRTLVH